MHSAFPDELVLVDAGMSGKSRLFRLKEDYRVSTSKGVITIPKGTLTDGASVPRVFWNIFDPFGKYFPAALLHDYLYKIVAGDKYNFTRKEIDLLFKEAMFNCGVDWMTRETVYRAVRLFGWKAFRKV